MTGTGETTESPILRYFEFHHLGDPKLRDISSCFRAFAYTLDTHLPSGAEKSVALRKLLEAKDAAVRASLA